MGLQNKDSLGGWNCPETLGNPGMEVLHPLPTQTLGGSGEPPGGTVHRDKSSEEPSKSSIIHPSTCTQEVPCELGKHGGRRAPARSRLLLRQGTEAHEDWRLEFCLVT